MGARLFGWGTESGALTAAEANALLDRVRPWLAITAPVEEPTLGEIELAPPRLAAAGALTPWMRSDPLARATHTYGQAYRDLVRRLERHFAPAPDLVARPPDEGGIVATLEWADAHDAVVIAFGGGTSVVGGIEAPCDDPRPVISLDLEAVSGVVEVDTLSLAARCRAGTRGPDLEAALAPRGLTLRHFPQSFEFSTVGGWLATHAAGHYATGPTRIDDAVESLRAVTPRGILETGRHPSWGAGPDPRAWLLGSEGALGIFSEAWLRVVARPTFHARVVARFPDVGAGVAAARDVAQSGLRPANARLLDPLEAVVSGAGDGGSALLLLGCESADHPVDGEMARLRELAADHGASFDDGDRRPDARWRDAFVRAPYARDVLVRAGLLVETFETVTTWDQLDALRHAAIGTAEDAVAASGSSGGRVSWRLTHLYPDGAALYVTVLAPARPHDRVGQVDEVRTALLTTLAAVGAPVTHHHAVGRVHQPALAASGPALATALLAGAKSVLDPRGLLSPGVLLASSRPGPGRPDDLG